MYNYLQNIPVKLFDTRLFAHALVEIDASGRVSASVGTIYCKFDSEGSDKQLNLYPYFGPLTVKEIERQCAKWCEANEVSNENQT